MKQATFFDGSRRLQMDEKPCSKCGVTKPLDAFGKATRERDGRRADCKACRKAEYDANAKGMRDRQAAYYHANLGARRDAQRAYNSANAEIIRDKERGRRAAMPDGQRAIVAVQKAEWKRRNPEKVAAISAAARHARRAAPGRFTAGQWRLLCAMYGHRCAACRSGGKLTPDHIVPVSRGGSNDIANIQPLCLDCNRRKATKAIVFGFQPYFNPARMLALPEAWLAGAPLPVVYQNGAVQPLLFKEPA